MLINHCLYSVLVLTTATFKMLQCSFTGVVRSVLENRQILKLEGGGGSRAPLD